MVGDQVQSVWFYAWILTVQITWSLISVRLRAYCCDSEVLPSSYCTRQICYLQLQATVIHLPTTTLYQNAGVSSPLLCRRYIKEMSLWVPVYLKAIIGMQYAPWLLCGFLGVGTSPSTSDSNSTCIGTCWRPYPAAVGNFVCCSFSSHCCRYRGTGAAQLSKSPW